MLDKNVEQASFDSRLSLVDLAATGSIILLLLPLSIDNIKFLVLAFSLFAYGVFILIGKKENFSIANNISSYCLIGFSLLSFASILWSFDSSLAIRSSFIWLLFILYTLVLASIIRQSKYIERYIAKLFAIVFLIFIVYHLVAIQFNIQMNADWNVFMSKNKNYTTTLLTCLSPFLLFYPSKSQFVRFLKIICSVLLLNLLFITGARGALLAFSIIILLKYWNFHVNSKFKYLGVLTGGFVIVYGIYFLNTSQLSSNFRFVREYRTELDSRILMNKNSIATFKNNLALGVGAGNWPLHVYSNGIKDTPPFNNPDEFVRHRSHNLFFKLLVEFGLFGFILFISPFIIQLYKLRNRWTEMSGYHKSAWTSIVAWLIVSYFYATAISYEYLFSGIALIGFTSLGILMSRTPVKNSIYSLNNAGLLLASLTCICWFTFSKINFDSFVSDKSAPGTDESKFILKLEERYHPFLNNSFDYKTSYTQLLADGYKAIGEHNKAETLYRLAINKRPHDESLLLSYAHFMIDVRKQPQEAKAMVDKIIAIQNNHVETIALSERITQMLKD